MSSSSFDTLWPADSVEFCPHPEATDVFVCGTYKLEQSSAEGLPVEEEQEGKTPAKQTRRGKCLLFTMDTKGDETLYVTQ